MKLFISDIKFIAHRPLLLTALLSPVIFTLFLLYLFPFISGLTRPDDTLTYGRYYSVTAITLISAIPFIYGLLFSFVHLKEHNTIGSAGDDIPYRRDKKRSYLKDGCISSSQLYSGFTGDFYYRCSFNRGLVKKYICRFSSGNNSTLHFYLFCRFCSVTEKAGKFFP